MLLHMSLQCQPMTNNGENGQICCWFASRQGGILQQLKCCTHCICDFSWCHCTKNNLLHHMMEPNASNRLPLAMGRLDQNFYCVAFRQGKFPFLSCIWDVRRQELCICKSCMDFIWIKESSCMYELVTTSPYFELFTKSKFISHLVRTERRSRESHSLEGFAWCSLKRCKIRVCIVLDIHS